MNNEIEIKLLATPASQASIVSILSQFPTLQRETKQLTSVYFDTPERQLMQWGIGLRVRSGDGESTQTLKTDGKVVGGLHQRPEYNVAIADKRPQLTLFDDFEWPDAADISNIEAQLSPLFSTEFERQTWLLDLEQDTLVEVAFDQGEIIANQASEVICELELELVKGDLQQLFKLAEAFAGLDGLRLANVSKAKRGYALALELAEEVKPIRMTELQPQQPSAEAITQILSHALEHWQYHEQLFVETLSPEALSEMYKAVQMFYQAAKMFEDQQWVKCSWLAELRWLRKQFAWMGKAESLQGICEDRGALIKKLPQHRSLLKTLNEQLSALPNEEQMSQLMHSARYSSLMLKITRWLYAEKWQFSAVLEQKSALELAVELLDASWTELQQTELAAEGLDAKAYMKQGTKLRRNLLVGLCVGALFEEQSRKDFRLPWVDILSGIEELRLFQPLHELLPELDEEQQQALEKWLARKEQSLVEALEFSRQQAWQQQQYWQA